MNRVTLVKSLIIAIASVGMLPPLASTQIESATERERTEEIQKIIQYAAQEVRELEQQSEYDRATALLQEALEIKQYQQSSNNFSVYVAIAKLYQEQEKYRESERLYLKAIESASELLADAIETVDEKAAEAENRIQEQYQQLTSITQDPQRVQLLEGRIKELQQAIASKQFQGQQLNAQQVQRLQETLTQLTNFRELAQNPEELSAKLSELQSQLSNQKLVRERKAKEYIANKIAVIYGNLASIYQAQEKTDETKALMEQALTILENSNSQPSETLNQLAQFYQSQGREREAGMLRFQASKLQ